MAPVVGWAGVPSIDDVQARHAMRLTLGAMMLLGLLLMHGFGGHAAHAAVHTGPGHTGPGHTGPGHTGPGHTGPGLSGAMHAGSSWSGGVQDSAAAPADHSCAGDCAQAVVAPAPGDPTPAGGLVALCAAALLALAALLLLRVTGQQRPALLQAPRAVRSTRPPGARAAPPPPDLLALSVRRC